MTEIILGPPGTGKTTTLLGIVDEELSAGTKPERVGYVSFTQRAANEAAERACRKFGLARKDLPNFRTIHSMCYQRLGVRSSDVLESDRLKEFADFAGIKMTGRWSQDGTLFGYEKGDRILFMENLSRIRCVPLRQQYEESGSDRIPWSEVERVARLLGEYKESEGLLDFTDMLSQFVEQGTVPELDVVVIDEAQDLSALQWRVIDAIVQHSGARRVLVAGDDDQAIYRWAGADVEHLIGMSGVTRVLGQSYRVPRAIREIARKPLSLVRHRREKEWSPKRDAEGRVVDGEVARVPKLSAMQEFDGESVLILARNSYILTGQIEPELKRRGLVYQRANGYPSVRPEYLEAARSWVLLRRGERVSYENARGVYKMINANEGGIRRGFKELEQLKNSETVSMGDLRERGGLVADGKWFEVLGNIPERDREYLRSALRRGESARNPRIRVSTIHGSKGGEADHVILMTEMAQQTHAEMKNNVEDEARVWYVGATRAQRKLTIVDASTARKCPWL